MRLEYKPTKKETLALRRKYGMDKTNSEGTIFIQGLDYYNFFREFSEVEPKEDHLLIKNAHKWGFEWLVMGKDFKWGVGSPQDSDKRINISFLDPGNSAALYNLVPWIGYSNTRFSLGYGTCGGFKKDMKVGDVILCTESYGDWEGAKYRLGKKTKIPADKNSFNALTNACKKLKIDYYKGKVYTISDVFLEPAFRKKFKIVEKGFIGVEYENYAAHVISKYYHKPFAAMLIVSDLPQRGETAFSSERAHSQKKEVIKILSEKFKAVVLASKTLIQQKNQKPTFSHKSFSP